MYNRSSTDGTTESEKPYRNIYTFQTYISGWFCWRQHVATQVSA